MTATQVDLRSTLGWRLSSHARQAARDRGVSVHDVLMVIAAPEITHTAWDYAHGRIVYKRGDLAVVGAPDTRTVITVLWSTDQPWTDEECRRHRLGLCT